VAIKGIIGEDEQSVHNQLELFGFDQLLAIAEGRLTGAALKQERRRIAAAHASMSDLSMDDVAFLHAGLCQTGLPHSRPVRNDEPWQRSNGRFHLVVEPGTVIDQASGKSKWVGVPYGTKARLIFMHVSTEGIKSRQVHLGRSMSAWMRRLGLSVSGGEHGTIAPIKEQTLRLGRARFSFQFETEGGGLGISDTQIADKLHFWATEDGPWLEEIELTDRFHEHLREHAVPLSDHAISYLSGSSLKLDLYAWAAWRLPRLGRPLRLNWTQIAATFAAAGDINKVAAKVREALPDVQTVYRDMKIETTRGGLILHPSKPPVPKTLVMVGGKAGG